MDHAAGGIDVSLTWKDGSRLQDFDFASDTLLINPWNDMAQLTKNIQTWSEKVLSTNQCGKNEVDKDGVVGERLDLSCKDKRTGNLTGICILYLGSYLSDDSSCDRG